jgi:predicted enzyme related to lactoylglutathione lyase
MSDLTVRGRFVWYDLLTPDTHAAQLFYSQALGWQTEVWEKEANYLMFAAADGPFGGLGQTEGEAHWLGYIWTGDMQATLDKARSLGAEVVVDATDIAPGSQYAVLLDPQGAAFGVYSSTAEPGPHLEPGLGHFLWHELATSDFESAFEFYSELFDWEAMDVHEMGDPVGTYLSFGRGGVPIGGMYTRSPEMPGGPGWLFYVRVKDLNRTLSQVEAAGGEVLFQPLEVPGGDVIAQFVDTNGAVCAAIRLAADSASKPKRAAAPKGGRTNGSTPPSATAQPATKTKRKTARKPAKDAAKPAAKPAGARASKASAKAKAKQPVRKAARKSSVTSKSPKKTTRPVRKTQKTAARATGRGARKAAKTPVKKPAKKARRAK